MPSECNSEKEADPSRDHDRFASRLSYEISEATFGNSPLGRTMQVTAWSGCPVSNVYLFYPPTDSPQEALMLDHPTKTAQLLADLKAVVPFEVELIPQLVRRLQAENVTEADREHLVYDLSYAGDEGGIVCHLSRSRNRGSARCFPDPCACAPLDAACFGCSRLSKAPSEKAKKAGSHLMFETSHSGHRPISLSLCVSGNQIPVANRAMMTMVTTRITP